MQTFCTPLRHMPCFVHLSCYLKTNKDFELSTYDYRKDCTFCAVCESAKLMKLGAAAPEPEPEHEDRVNSSGSPLPRKLRKAASV